MSKRYAEIAEIVIDVAVAFAAYHWLGWIGFSLWVLFLGCWFVRQLVSDQHVIMKALLSRLPDRCAFCHREIVDEGGVFDENGIYHEKCLDKRDSLEAHRKEAGVQAHEAIHRPQPRTP
jgi:hypothetical protein